MRISDWSSDVCSSDLGPPDHRRQLRDALRDRGRNDLHTAPLALPRKPQLRIGAVARMRSTTAAVASILRPDRNPEIQRSEEHTSELQSLMRISYAVFCLKKKKKITLIPIEL